MSDRKFTPSASPTIKQPEPVTAERVQLAIERVRNEIAIHENAQPSGVLDSPALDFLEDLKILSGYELALAKAEAPNE